MPNPGIKGGAKNLSQADVVAGVRRADENLRFYQKEYLGRLDRMSMEHKCDGGHPDCAIVAGGPCSANFETLGY